MTATPMPLALIAKAALLVTAMMATLEMDSTVQVSSLITSRVSSVKRGRVIVHVRMSVCLFVYLFLLL